MSNVSHHEMQLLKRLLLLLVRFAVLLGVGGLIIYGVVSFASYVGSVPKELGAALVAGATTIIVATITVMVGRHFERKKELDALYRDKKTEIYEAFLNVFFQVWFSGGKTEEGKEDPDLVSTFREFSVKLVLWSGPQALEAFAKWKEFMAEGHANAQAIFQTEEFLNAIRLDLRHSNSGIRKGWFARLFLQEGAVFLAMAEKDPKVSLAALLAAEKEARAQKEKRAG